MNNTVKVDTVRVDGRKYIDISDLICWLYNEGHVSKEIIAELERLRGCKHE